MDSLSTWWSALEPLTQWFYSGAAFFSVLFVWQLIAALMGLSGGDHDVGGHADGSAGHDVHGDAGHDDGGGHHDTTLVFRLLSVRSILAFGTLFTWAGALYLDSGEALAWALFYAFLWGFVAFIAVAGLLELLPRLSQSGNLNMATAIDTVGTVYLDIPEKGEGEIRILVSGVMTHVRAHTRNGEAVKAGASVRVLRLSSPNTVEVELVPALKA